MGIEMYNVRYVYSIGTPHWSKLISKVFGNSPRVWNSNEGKFTIVYLQFIFFILLLTNNCLLYVDFSNWVRQWPVERIFSGGTDLVVQKRCSLKDETIQKVMCLKGWWKSDLGISIILTD